jgi:hypothetical protein
MSTYATLAFAAAEADRLDNTSVVVMSMFLILTETIDNLFPQ